MTTRWPRSVFSVRPWSDIVFTFVFVLIPRIFFLVTISAVFFLRFVLFVHMVKLKAKKNVRLSGVRTARRFLYSGFIAVLPDIVGSGKLLFADTNKVGANDRFSINRFAAIRIYFTKIVKRSAVEPSAFIQYTHTTHNRYCFQRHALSCVLL